MVELKLQDFDAGKIADSGQCFRMVKRLDGSFFVVAAGRCLRVRGQGEYWRFSCSPEEFDGFWRHYFDLDSDYSQYRARCKKTDRFLQEAIAAGGGIRILNQDPWEMLICFIISQRKSIPAIRTAVETLCGRFGRPLEFEGERYYAFPEPLALAACSEEDLRACGLGYRAPYVLDAALRATGELSLQGLAVLSTNDLRQALMQISGVGIKVAECVALFGYHRLEAFPIDVWIERVVREVYRGKFPPSYRCCAGVLQQYLFCYARQQKLR